jgi:hypothetical protein
LGRNRAWIQELIDLGSQGTPTTVVEGDDGAREVIVGFDRKRLAKALGL